jgi:hypothetical protein
MDGVPHTLIVTFLAGGQGFTNKIESVADLRAHAKAIQGLKPIPSWLFSVLDNIEEQVSEHPGESLEDYMHGNISELQPHQTATDGRLTLWKSGDALGQVPPTRFRAAG